MRVEILAVGTELLLGQIVDTNSTMIAGKLAENGFDSYFQVRVGDNLERIKFAIRDALARSDALIICGGLGPTQDDITREAIAAVMGVELELNEELAKVIEEIFVSRGRQMSKNNLNQAMVPKGASYIRQVKGTAPGLICPVGRKVIYAAPGVPYELSDMLDRAIIPDLRERSEETFAIASRVIRTWGLSESKLAELLDPLHIDLEGESGITLAFLASGIEGIKARLTARAETTEAAKAKIAQFEPRILEVVGDYVFGYDDETMESVVGRLLQERGLTLSVAESLTGGLVASRIVNVAGASEYFLGGVVTYATPFKRSLLGVEASDVVSVESAIEMAKGVRALTGSNVALSFTGVAGPSEQNGHPVGTCFVGLDVDGEASAHELKLPGDRDRIRQFAAISGQDLLRRALVGLVKKAGVQMY